MRVAHSKGSFNWVCLRRTVHYEVRLRVRDMIPLLSWLLIRGRCRSCAISIPIRYPLSELIAVESFVLIWRYAGWIGSLSLHGQLLSLCLWEASLI